MATEKFVMAVIRACRPSFRNSHDKVAFVVHASFLASGFVLTATGPPAFADNALTSSSSDEVGIEGWNEVEDEYAFVYVDPEKANKKVLVKCLVMGDKLMVDAVSDGASELGHLDINVDECVAETDATDYNAQYKNLAKLVRRLVSDFLVRVMTLHVISTRSSNEPNRNIDGSGSSEESPARFVLPPVSPVGGSDLYPSGRAGIYSSRFVLPPVSLVGGSDLYPSGGAGIYPSRFVLPLVSPVGGSELYPSGGAGIYPSRGGFGSGSMIVGPDYPIFGGRGAFSDVPGGPGGFGVPPPGATFDPYGPPGVPGFEPGRFVRFPRGRTPDGGPHPDLQPGSGGPGRRVHPDLEQPGSGGFDFI